MLFWFCDFLVISTTCSFCDFYFQIQTKLVLLPWSVNLEIASLIVYIFCHFLILNEVWITISLKSLPEPKRQSSWQIPWNHSELWPIGQVKGAHQPFIWCVTLDLHAQFTFWKWSSILQSASSGLLVLATLASLRLSFVLCSVDKCHITLSEKCMFVIFTSA